MRPQRRLELAVIASAVVFVLVLAFSFRGGRRPASGSGPERELPPAPEASGQATTLLEGFDFTESLKGKPLMRIQADRTIGYGPAAGLAPNLYAGEKVQLTVYPDDGPPVTVHSERAKYDERTRESRLSGNVRWTDKDGGLAETEEIVFRPKTRMLEAPSRVHFTQGPTSLTAPSAKYDIAERVMHFAGPVEASGTGSDSGGLSKMTARQGLYRRDSGSVELEFVTGESRSGDRVAADRLVLQMAAEGGRPSWARLTGNVRGVLAADGPRVAPAASAGTAGATDPAAPPPLGRQYSGNVGTVTFDSEGRTKSVRLEGAPAMLSEAERRLTAKRIDIGLENGRAVTASATGEVKLDSANGHAEAARGTLGFAPDGTAQNSVLEGGVRMTSDGRSGDAEKVVELTARRLWQLTGGPRQAARVQSGGSKLSADVIEIDRDGQIVRGQGRARAVFTPDAQKKVRMTGFVGDPKKPTYGKADLIVLEDSRRQGSLSGSASLWQEDSSLFADDIALDDTERTVRASGSVRTVMAPTPAPAKTAGAEVRPASVITSKRLLYRDSDRSARFEGGVAVTRGGWRASGGESTAWLDKDGQVESVEISGQVKMSDRATGRSATADKALVSPKIEKTVLWGSPARVTDAAGSQVAGAVLTIANRGRSVEITAPEGGKTETIHRTQKD